MKKGFLQGIIGLLLVFGMAFAGCGNPADDGGGEAADITYEVRANGSTSMTTTALTFTFSEAVTGLTAGNITITGVTKGDLTGGGTVWTLAVTVSTAQNITVSIAKTGIESGKKLVPVYKAGQAAPPAIYTITFNGNGGSSPASQTVDAGGSITLPSSTWSGYTLNGWYTASSGETKVGNAGASYTPSASVTLFAQWTASGGTQPTQCTITFDSQYGSAVASITRTAGTQVSKPADPTRAGYTFNGWYSATSGGTLYFWPYTLNGYVRMYAQWTENAPTQYTITFNGNGVSSPSSLTVNAGESITLPSSTRSGYTLNGWYNASSGGTKVGNAGASYTPSASVTLFAQWTRARYTITFNGNGGSSPDYKTVNAGDSITLPSSTRSGYTLNGWYTASSDGTKAGNAGASYTPSASVTLYAQWTRAQYTITFDSQGGSAVAAITENIGTAVQKPADPTKMGYIFNDWYSASNGGRQYDWPYTLNGNVTMYAQWQPITYTVKYDANEGTGTTNSSSHTYDKTKNLTYNGFTRTDYTFAGWNTFSNGSGTSYADGQSVKNLTNRQGETVTLYAQWTINYFGQPITLTINDFIDHAGGAITQAPFTLSKSSNQSKTITVSGGANPVWYIGLAQIGTGSSVTVYAANLSVGRHALRVTALYSGKRYSKEITFTVQQ
jgi:uncharacterized repeat protein (TIGR02543 family)